MTRDEIGARLDRFRESLTALESLPQATLTEFLADRRNLYSAIYLLQTSIQALIDIGSHVSARLGLAVPKTSRDVLANLEAASHLPPGSTQRFGPMFAFRNRVVHLYERIDPEIVYRVLREHRNDLGELMGLFLALP